MSWVWVSRLLQYTQDSMWKNTRVSSDPSSSTSAPGVTDKSCMLVKSASSTRHTLYKGVEGLSTTVMVIASCLATNGICSHTLSSPHWWSLLGYLPATQCQQTKLLQATHCCTILCTTASIPNSLLNSHHGVNTSSSVMWLVLNHTHLLSWYSFSMLWDRQHVQMHHSLYSSFSIKLESHTA